MIVTVMSAEKIFAYQGGDPEGASVYSALLAVRTGHLYHQLASSPYTPQPYGPFFYAINSVIARASHLDVDLTIRRGRLLTFGSFFLCGLTIYLISRKLRFSHASSSLAALMLLGQPVFFPLNIVVRPDVPSLLAMLLCLLFALLEGQLGQAAYVLSGILAGSAFLIKQSAISVPIAIAAVLLLRKRYKPAASFALSASVPLVLVLGILLSRHEPFMEHFSSIKHSVWSLMGGARWSMRYLAETSNAVPLALGGVGFMYAITSDERAQMIASFTLVSLFAGFATIQHLGGGIAYFLPALAGCALLLPFAIRAVSRNVRVTSVLAIVGLLSATAGGAVAVRDLQYGDSRAWQQSTYERLHSLRIITDGPNIRLLHARDPEFLDPWLMHALELTKHWDPSAIIKSVRHGDFDLVILACGHVICSWRGISKFGIPLVNALNENYQVLCATNRALVLEPRAREAGVTPEWLSSALGRSCISSMLDRAPSLSLEDGVQ